jgi:cytochrome c
MPAVLRILLVLLASITPAASETLAKRADVKAGEEVYTRCLACHALGNDRTGPRHCGLFGRRAGSVKGFPYSDAMKQSKIVWDERTLAMFLANPTENVPGTTMGYAGVRDETERADLIAYLRQANESAACGKQDFTGAN